MSIAELGVSNELPAWIESANAIEIAGCVERQDPDGKGYVMRSCDTDDNPEFWTIYVRTPIGEALAVDDMQSIRQAIREARKLRSKMPGKPDITCVALDGGLKPLKRVEIPRKP